MQQEQNGFLSIKKSWGNYSDLPLTLKTEYVFKNVKIEITYRFHSEWGRGPISHRFAKTIGKKQKILRIPKGPK